VAPSPEFMRLLDDLRSQSIGRGDVQNLFGFVPTELLRTTPGLEDIARPPHSVAQFALGYRPRMPRTLKEIVTCIGEMPLSPGRTPSRRRGTPTREYQTEPRDNNSVNVASRIRDRIERPSAPE
jgi:hypothetical protein